MGRGSGVKTTSRWSGWLGTRDSRLIWWTMEKAMIPIIDAFKSQNIYLKRYTFAFYGKAFQRKER